MELIILSIVIILIILFVTFYIIDKLKKCSNCEKHDLCKIENKAIKTNMKYINSFSKIIKGDPDKNILFEKVKNNINNFIFINKLSPESSVTSPSVENFTNSSTNSPTNSQTNNITNSPTNSQTNNQTNNITNSPTNSQTNSITNNLTKTPIQKVELNIYLTDTDTEILEVFVEKNNLEWIEFKTSQIETVKLIKELLIKYEIDKIDNEYLQYKPSDFNFNSQRDSYTICLFNKIKNLILINYKNELKKIIKKIWTIYFNINKPIIKIQKYNKIKQQYPNILHEKTIKKLDKNTLYKLFINKSNLDKKNMFSKLIKIEDHDILSNIITDIMYQKVNLSLYQFHDKNDFLFMFNKRYNKFFKNNSFKIDNLYNNVIDELDFFNNFIFNYGSNLKKNNTRINFYFNYFGLILFKWIPELSLIKEMNLKNKLIELFDKIIIEEKKCFIDNKKNGWEFIEITKEVKKGEVYCRYYDDQYC